MRVSSGKGQSLKVTLLSQVTLAHFGALIIDESGMRRTVTGLAAERAGTQRFECITTATVSSRACSHCTEAPLLQL